jgi:hypothetical protein
VRVHDWPPHTSHSLRGACLSVPSPIGSFLTGIFWCRPRLFVTRNEERHGTGPGNPGEGLEFAALYNDPERLMREREIEQRYALRVRLLRYSAFQGIARYRPATVAKKLTRRLFDRYRDDDPETLPSRNHITAMNSIGLEMKAVHSAWLNLRRIGYQHDFDLKKSTSAAVQRTASLAVIELMDRVRHIHTIRLNIAELRRVATPKESGSLALKALGSCSPAQFR